MCSAKNQFANATCAKAKCPKAEHAQSTFAKANILQACLKYNYESQSC